MGSSKDIPDRSATGARFKTTVWGLVMAAADSDDPHRREALGQLCGEYWPPLYAFLRRRGHDPHAAADLTQGFVARLLEKGDIAGANPDRGRFRSYVLGALKHYVQNERDRFMTKKRGGGYVTSLDAADGESLYENFAVTKATPDRAFERSWALQTLDTALDEVGRRMDEAGKLEVFETLKAGLAGDGSSLDYEAASAKLQLSVNSLYKRVSDLRKVYAETLRRIVARTVASPQDVESEIRDLMTAVSRSDP